MTVSSTIDLATSSARSTRQLHSRLLYATFAVLAFALVTGAWLAFFTFLPLDFTTPRVG